MNPSELSLTGITTETWLWLHTALLGALSFASGALVRTRGKPVVATPAADTETIRLREALSEAHAFVARAADPNELDEVKRALLQERADKAAARDAERRLTAECATLRREAAVVPELRRELARLRDESRPLRDPVAVARTDRTSGSGAWGLPSLTAGTRLQSLVDRVRRDNALEGAVVADELGLVVASSGEHGEELAAVGAALARSSAQLQKLLPMSRLGRLTLEDEQHHSITVRPLQNAEAELALVTFGGGAKTTA